MAYLEKLKQTSLLFFLVFSECLCFFVQPYDSTPASSNLQISSSGLRRRFAEQVKVEIWYFNVVMSRRGTRCFHDFSDRISFKIKPGDIEEKKSKDCRKNVNKLTSACNPLANGSGRERDFFQLCYKSSWTKDGQYVAGKTVFYVLKY